MNSTATFLCPRSSPGLLYELLLVYFLILKDGKRPFSVSLFSASESCVPCYSERKVVLVILEINLQLSQHHG